MKPGLTVRWFLTSGRRGQLCLAAPIWPRIRAQQSSIEPCQRQVETWRRTQITDETAKLIFYTAFIDGKLEAPRSLLPEVHRLYFWPEYPEFSARTMLSLSNAFTSAFKKLDPVPQFKATAKLGLSRTIVRHNQRLGPLLVAIISRGSDLFQDEERLRDSDPFSNFQAARFVYSLSVADHAGVVALRLKYNNDCP
jgi:hypothetical protein